MMTDVKEKQILFDQPLCSVQNTERTQEPMKGQKNDRNRK